MIHKGNYIFTNKNHPQRAVLSTILGVISLTSIFLTLYFTLLNHGRAPLRYGFTVLTAMLFSIVGLMLGILSRVEPDKFYFFSYLGIVINVLVLIGIGYILFAGAYGI